VAAPCADRNPFAQCCDCGKHHANQATPAKLSQKPAASTDSGSKSSTAITARASESTILAWRRESRASTTTAIISTVRVVGNAKPASAA
jgi:hypothetical protein